MHITQSLKNRERERIKVRFRPNKTFNFAGDWIIDQANRLGSSAELFVENTNFTFPSLVGYSKVPVFIQN